MKSRGWVALLFLLTTGVFAQSSAPPAESTPADEPKPAEVKPVEVAPAPAMAVSTSLQLAKPIAMIDYAQWEDETRVAGNIVKECGSLGKQFADATENAGRSQDLKFDKSPQSDPRKAEQGLALKLVSATSAGNAFTGHRKSVTARAEFYVGGKVARTTTFTRDSMGGALGGFKGSCSVLERTVTTLGSDVVRWLKQDMR